MPFIHTATPDDLPALAAMRAAEGWAINDWLLDLVCHWQGGRIFVVRPDRAPVAGAAAAAGAPPLLAAATSAVAFGALGVVGNVIVHPAYRRQGLGKLLMRAAIDWLADQGVRAVELDATPDGRPLYTQLGFVGVEPTWSLWAPIHCLDRERLLALGAGQETALLGADGLGAVATLDRLALGGDRLGLLAGLLRLPETRAYVAPTAGGEPVGYLVVRPPEPPHIGLRLGPWVARTPAGAAALLARALPGMASAARPSPDSLPHLAASFPGASHPARALYAALGLPLMEDDLRMRLDLPRLDAPPAVTRPPAAAPDAAARPDWIYAMLAPMVG